MSSRIGLLLLFSLLLVAKRTLADDWDVTFDKSTMDDSQSVFLATEAVNTVPGTLDIQQVRPTLWIRCHENKTSLYVDWARYISTAGLDGEQSVRYWIDDKPAKRTAWAISTDFEATGLWSGGSSIPLIRQLASAKKFQIEVTPYGASTIRAEFNVAGLDQHISDVQKACGWSATASTSGSSSKKQKKPATDDTTESQQELGSGAASSVPAASNESASPHALPGASADEQYQYAFDLMRQTKYDDAEKALSMFVDDHPDHPLAGNATYWLGEAYYIRRDYNNAALTFAQAFQKYPQSGKAPDSLLKLGMSLAALSETADACKALHELRVRYPRASDGTKQRAAKEWAKNGCQ